MLLNAAHEGSTESQSEQLLLWALDGLSGVVINGIPNNLPGTRAASVPKAVLWGQHCSALMWPKTAGMVVVSVCIIARISRLWGLWQPCWSLTVLQSAHLKSCVPPQCWLIVVLSLF